MNSTVYNHRAICARAFSTIYEKGSAFSEINTTLLCEVTIFLFGILGNILMLYLLCRRRKLNTASFIYLRIQAILQLCFFVLPFPLSVLVDLSTDGDSWLSINFLPMPLGIFHLLIASIRCCFVFRLQIVINNLRRCRTWNSYAWIAWRKVCWLVPIMTIISIPLCFEYRVDTYRCMSTNGGNLIKSVGVARHSDFGRIAFIKIDLIQALPTIIYWFTLFSAVIYFICEWCIRPRFASPIIQKHSPFFSNIRPLLIALIFALSVIHLPATIAYLNHDDLKPKTKLLLYATSYAVPPFLMLSFSRALRQHFRLMVNQYLSGRNTDKNAPPISNVFTCGDLSGGLPVYSRLEMENSEVDDRHFGGRRSAVREALHADAVHRVRFAIPSSLPSLIIETDEHDDCVENTKKDLNGNTNMIINHIV